MRTNQIISESETKRMQNEITVFAQTLIPYYLNGNLNLIYKMGYNFGYKNIDNIPRNAQILKEESNGILYFKIFSYDSFIGFSISFLEDSINFVKQKDNNAWNNYKILILLFQLGLIFLLLFFLFYQIMRPLNKLKDSINELKNGIYAKKLKINQYDEIGLLFRDFNEMNEKISRMLKARELITRNIAHELRMPLAKIKLAISLKDGVELKEDLKKYIDSLNRISQNMLEFERIQSEGFELKNDEFLSESVVFEALKDLGGNKISLNIIKSIKIKGDLHLLSVAIKNLIENAIKYSDDGVVDIELNEEGIVFINKGKELQNDISYYFEPFYRGDITKSGYGLGLSIVKEIISLHKMNIIYKYDCGRHIFILCFKRNIF
ncbi:ATP-binding protein [Helicobacter sp. MIT 14-3879]|uniref:ATP-binding protein n=1 Tax=Helicobacter sp. MIT 14-3879 TaxID=2040649 RepID=UPI0011C0254D|nr:ATP-binding protein [Helicobacter sp. MIT 14-3879]